MNQGYDQKNDPSGFQVRPADAVSPSEVVVHTPDNVNTLVIDHSQASHVRWSWLHLVMSVISLFCCPIFGVIATVSSTMSYVDHKTKDYERSVFRTGYLHKC